MSKSFRPYAAPVAPSNGVSIFVIHSGADLSPEGRERKRARDLRLLELDLKDRPEHSFVLFNLGMTYCEMREFGRAADFLERSLHAANGRESHVRKAFSLLASCRAGLEQFAAARHVCREGLRRFSDDPELLFRMGDLAQRAGRLKEAEAVYSRLLAAKRGRHFASIDQGILGFKTWQRLAAVCGELGQWSRAESLWRQVAEEVPDRREALCGQVDALLKQNKLTEAKALSNRLLESTDGSPDPQLIAAKLARAEGDLTTARRQLEAALERHSDDPRVLQDWCQFAFENTSDDEARRALERLIARCPDDGAAHHNLGTTHLRAGRHGEAIDCYRESLRVRPSAPQTHLHLGLALVEVGQRDEAVQAWKEVSRLAPDSPLARAAEQHAQRIQSSPPAQLLADHQDHE